MILQEKSVILCVFLLVYWGTRVLKNIFFHISLLLQCVSLTKMPFNTRFQCGCTVLITSLIFIWLISSSPQLAIYVHCISSNVFSVFVVPSPSNMWTNNPLLSSSWNLGYHRIVCNQFLNKLSKFNIHMCMHICAFMLVSTGGWESRSARSHRRPQSNMKNY